MKAFHFTLESVLTLRQRQDQEATGKYAQSLLAQQQVLARLETAERELSNCWRELRAQLMTGCTASQAAQGQAYHRSLEKRREECAVQLRVEERRVNAALRAMLAARQQREVVDKFFDKQKKRHDYGCLQEERKLMDEFAPRRAASRMSWSRAESFS